jgi:hypothetical protein
VAAPFIRRETDGHRIRTDHIINRRHVFSPARFAGEGAPPPYAILYLGGLVRDIVEGGESYRYGSDFSTYNAPLQHMALVKASGMASEWTNRDALSGHGRRELAQDDYMFWKRTCGHMPRFFPVLIAGVQHDIAAGRQGELPFTDLDPFSRNFVHEHFRLIETANVPLLQYPHD